MLRLLLSFLLAFFLLFCFSQNEINMKAAYTAADKLFQQAEQLSKLAASDDTKQEDANQKYRQAYRAFTRLQPNLEKSGNDSLAFFSRLKAAFSAYYLDSVNVALKDYLSVITLKEKLRSIPDSFLFQPYLYTGGIYYSQNQFDSALSFYKKAEQVKDKYPRPLNESQRLYNRLGVMYYETGNYRQSGNYFEKALEVLAVTDPGNISLLANYKINIAALYINLEEFTQAKSVYTSLLSYNIFQNEIYHNLGIIYQKEKDYKKSIEYLRKVNYDNNKKTIDLYYHLGVAFTELHEPDSSELYFHKALAENIKWNGHRNNIQLGLILKYQADQLANQRLYKEATVRYQETARQFDNAFTETDFTKNPEQFSGAFSYIHLFNTLSAKGDVLESWYHQEKDIQLLKASFAAYQAAFKLANYVEKTYDSDESRLFLGKIKYGVHSRPIDISLQLYELTREKKYLEEAFLFDQQNKASILSLNVQENEIKTLPGETRELTRQVSLLKRTITRLTLKSFQVTDSNQLLQINNGIRDQEIELGNLQKKLNDDPYWQQIISVEKIPTIHTLQKKLDNYTALLSYHLSENELLTFLVTSTRFEYQRTPITKKFFTDIELIKTSLNNTSPEQRYTGTGAAMDLYKQLISPVQSKLSQINRLLLIPDDELNYLPFEALQDESKKYLLERFSIQYQYTTALLGENEKRKRSSGILSFAPFAKKGYTDSSGNNLGQLPASGEEIANLPGLSFSDSAATKTNFLQLVNHFGMVHLATHATVNNEIPSRSFIAFYPGNHEYKLYAQEIYNLKLDSAKLVILSACETGAGKLIKGEGLMSLSRAFAYAGCPNIITSLWKAEDKTTAYIMQRLHYYLGKKYTKDKALQQAKLDLLQDTEMDPRFKSPNYWANLIFIGNYETRQNSSNWWWIALGIIIGASLYLFAKRKSQPEINRQA
ncbi:MAG: CHAT domain-containing protein [Chitinophagaceae bacterium]|nr:CHAT domain-containing protein [Chitinophagaceae bacterium]